MADAYLGQIEMFAFGLVPTGWVRCDGSTYPISGGGPSALFSVLGTAFGGDGRITFGVPDLRGRTPVDIGNAYSLGELFGLESVALGPSTVPDSHFHQTNMSTAAGTTPTPASDKVVAAPTGVTMPGSGSFTVNLYSGASVNGQLDQHTISPFQGQAHENRMPFLVVNYCICWSGPYPS